ncbi:hypothetical protein BJY52DRAFT_548926 [Lactarius psammicola]|nr:hypothetical protein BJY52DRAFT_548926 [Lactarius psammicola]
MAPGFFSKLVKTQSRTSDSLSRPTSPTSSSSLKSEAARTRALSSPAKPSNPGAQPSFRIVPPQYSPSSTSLSSDPSVTVIPPSPQSHTSSLQSEQANSSAPKERGNRNRPAALSNLDSSTAPVLDSGMPTPTPTSNKTLGFDGNERPLAPSSSTSSLRDRVRSVVSSRSSSRSRSRIEPTAPSSSAPSGPQFATNISSEPNNAEDPLAQMRSNSNGSGFVVAPSAESITGTNEYQTSPTSSTAPTPTQARAFTVGASNPSSSVPESQFLSPSRIRDSDTVSISSTTSARKRRLWRRSSTTSTASPKQQRSTGLASALVASVTNSNSGTRPSSTSSPAAAAPDPSRRSASISSTPASPPRRKGTAVKRSPALSGHHAAASQSSIDMYLPGTHSRQGSLSARAPEHESDYVSSAEGHDDEVEDDSEDDALLAELNDGDIPVTGFAVASNKRNADFHELFRTIPEGDYLIEDYGCALQREILVQGRIYISENHICFHANIFGWVTDLIVPIYDIVSLEKKMTAFVIPNAIQITTRTTKYTFASFLARDTAYDVIYNIWRLARPEDGFSEAESMGRSALDATHTLGVGVTPNGPGAIANGPGVIVPVHKVTQCACGREGKHYSELAMDVVLPGTPERIYNLMFASGFLKDFMRENQKLEDIQMSDWAPTPGDQNCLARNMSYIKPLNSSIGPKSTKCEIHDETVHSDFDDYITMVTTTRTPDVPSGSVFSVKTRTCVTWASSASSRVVVTSQVEWTGRSFIKGIIEKSAIEGQKSYQNDLVRAMRSYIHEHQTEFIPAGLDPAAVADVVQEPSASSATQAMAGGAVGEGDEMAHKARERKQDQRGLQWAYDTLEGTLSVARQSAAGAIELLRDAWESQFSQSSSPSSAGTTTTTSSAPSSPPTSSTASSLSSQPSTSTILYAVIAVLVLSNLWTLTLVGKRDDAAHRKDNPRPRPTEEREKWVQGIVTALWHELEAGRQPGAASSSPGAANQALPQPPPPGMQLPDQWREEVVQLRLALDTVEERVRAVRQSLAELD